MAGSSANCAAPITALSTMMANQLTKFRAEVEADVKKTGDREQSIFKILQSYVKKSKKIRFEGDNYSDDWKKEAAKRGLNNLASSPDALGAYISKSTIDLCKKTGVFSEKELHAHYEAMIDGYNHKMMIESRTLEELCLNYVMPAASEFQTNLLNNLQGLKNIGQDAKKVASYQVEMVERISTLMNKLHATGKKMSKAREQVLKYTASPERAEAFCQKVKPLMDEIREYCDDLELIVDDRIWPLIKYRELLFMR